MPNRRCAFATASLPTGSGQAIPVTEASVEIGLDGRLRVTYREVAGGRDRSEPPSRGEFLAALARYRNRRMTPEQHRAVLAVFAACRPSFDPSTSSGLRTSGAQSDTSSRKGDTTGAEKATLLAPKTTLHGARRHNDAAR